MATIEGGFNVTVTVVAGPNWVSGLLADFPPVDAVIVWTSTVWLEVIVTDAVPSGSVNAEFELNVTASLPVLSVPKFTVASGTGAPLVSVTVYENVSVRAFKQVFPQK